jgi:hypothetical protein
MNDRLHVLEVRDRGHEPFERLMCECSAMDCTRLIELTAVEYLAVREDGARFVVYPGDEHVNPQIERVAARHERYWVVTKLGDAGDLAEELEELGPSQL